MINNRKPYQLVSSEWKKEKTIVKVKNTLIGGDNFSIMAGPCAVESEEQIYTICGFLSKFNIKILRGGAYKPRTSPYSFQGLKKEGLILLNKAAKDHNMSVVTEILDTRLVDEVAEYADILQLGTRNMQNYQLLKALGKIDKPILLKRGMSSTIEEWLLAAEYILSSGNPNVILCERGIRTFESATRNTLDISSMALVKILSHLPVISDPSQGTGIRDLIKPMTLASMAAGADGAIIEVHNQPKEAMSDGDQSLYFDQFEELLRSVKKMAPIVNKKIDFSIPKKVLD